MKKFSTMFFSFLAVALLLVGCGNSNTDTSTASNEIKLKNGVIITIDNIELKDKYGDLTANASSAAFVVSMTAENTAEKEQSFGTSAIALNFNGTTVYAEMLSGGTSALRYYDTIPAGESVSGDAVFAMPATFTSSDEAELLFTNVIGDELGSYKFTDLTSLVKSDSTPTVTTGTDGMQSGEVGGVKLSVGAPTIYSADEAQALYPELLGLSRGYVYVIADIAVENNSDTTLNDFFNIALYDEYNESSTARAINYNPADNAEAFNTRGEIAPGDTHSGKVAWIMKDDVTELTIKYAPLSPADKTKIEIKIMG